MNVNNFGVCFSVPDYKYSDYDLNIIEKSVKTLFDNNYKKLDDVKDNQVWTIVYVIQPPLLKNDSSFTDFFEKLQKLLEITRDYNSRFYNEPEVTTNND
jgi:hypothetical protein